jgi:hypothetical protein
VNQERRKYTRHKIGNALSINPAGVYQVVDIGQGGFCFKCPSHTALPESWEVDILNSCIPLEGFPARKVWVSLYENDKSDQPYLMVVGAKFGKLKSEQKVKLEKILESISQGQIL